MKNLPTFQCYSCGNCELKFNDQLEQNPTVGFCYRFFENVLLEEKNLSCWTTKPHTHFEDLAVLKPELLKNQHFRNLNKAKNLKIDLNQQTLF